MPPEELTQGDLTGPRSGLILNRSTQDTPMLETLLATALLVGSVEIGPGIHQEQYLTEIDNVPVLIEIETDRD